MKKPPGKVEDNIVTAQNVGALLFAVNFNLGLRPGRSLVDYDLDLPEARQLADLLLFNLPKFGRATARGSHRLVRCKAAKSRKFDIPELKGMEGLPEEHAVCVLEVRAFSNTQTMAPPSVHPNGEAVDWERDMPIPEDSAEGILQKAGLLAFLSVVARHYPGQGSRDDFCIALAGALLAAGPPVEYANRCIIRVAEVARDEEAPKRGNAGQTAAKASEGEPVTGIPRAVEMMGLPAAVAGRFRKWLGIKDAVRLDDDRATVVYDGNRLHETIAAAEDAVIAAGVPIYRQTGGVVRAARLDEAEDDDGVRRPAGALLIRGVKQHILRATMTSVVNFVSPGGTQAYHAPHLPRPDLP